MIHAPGDSLLIILLKVVTSLFVIGSVHLILSLVHSPSHIVPLNPWSQFVSNVAPLCNDILKPVIKWWAGSINKYFFVVVVNAEATIYVNNFSFLWHLTLWHLILSSREAARGYGQSLPVVGSRSCTRPCSLTNVIYQFPDVLSLNVVLVPWVSAIWPSKCWMVLYH